MRHIPIVMSTDNNYVPLVVALTSLVENAGKDTFYDIYILTDSAFTQESIYAVENSLSAYKSKCSLSFRNVGNIFDNVFINLQHTTSPTYFRLLIPDLLNEDKCIYLDTDTIVMTDLQELFDTSLDYCYIAGVWHPLIKREEKICRDAKIPSHDQYINAGVLLMNISSLRKDGMVKRFLELIPQNMPVQDQDIINHACYGKIALIPFKYNVMTKLADKCIEDYKGYYAESELREAWNSPCIIHYADVNKPWNSKNCIFIDYWWKFCKKSSIYECIASDFFSEFVNNVIYGLHNDSIFTKKLPTLYDITFKRKYVVYGAGKRAREVIAFMKQIKIIPEFIVVSEMDENPSEIEGIEVKDIVNAGQMLFDKSILIAIREKFHKEIIRNLQRYNYIELLPVSDNAILS